MIAKTHEEQVMILTEKVARLECNVYEMQRTMNSIINDLSHEFLKNALADRKTEPQYDFGEYADRLWKIAYERGKREALEQTEPSCDTCKLKDTTEWCKRQEVCRAYEPKTEPQTEIRVEHPNGYAGVLYGKSSMVVYDKDGNECLHTGFRTPNTEEELYEVLETMPRFIEILASVEADRKTELTEREGE